MIGTGHVQGVTYPYPPATAAFTPKTVTGFAKVTGTFLRPTLELHINSRLAHPSNRALTMLDWVRQLRGRWDPGSRTWTITGLNTPDPALALRQAGIELDWEQRPEEFASVLSIDDLVAPVAKLAENGRTVLVRPRFAGFEYAKELLGQGAVWDKDFERFQTPVIDVLTREGYQLFIRPGVHWPQEAIDLAIAAHQYVPVQPELTTMARRFANALTPDEFTDEELAWANRHIGVLPDDGREPFPYQKVGSLAVAAGRTCLWDEPGVGKSAGSLLAARILGAKRTVIVVPPLLTTNWRREIAYAKLCEDTQVVTYKSGRKERDLPDEGAIIVPDSLLASRPELLRKIIAWEADVMIVDEAHRIKTIGSARGEAVLDLGASVRHAPIALTGTPMFQSPHEMVTMLELTRMLAPVFGGRHHFLADFCLQDPFGGWKARKTALPRLNYMLAEHVWVRRKKADVLPQLPPKIRLPIELDIPLREYHEVHKQVIAKIQGWVTWFTEHNGRKPTQEEFNDWVRASAFTLISQLREAAGLAKIKVAADLVREHIEQTGWEIDAEGRKVFNRPILVWVHHRSVAQAMFEAVPEELGVTGVIGLDVTDNARDALVDAFQAGHVAVLVCSIVKAGVGLTLTRGQDAIFVETDWTPANIVQAEDREHRPGAVGESVLYKTLIALGTLDETIQRVLGNKVEILEKGLGGSGGDVALMASDDARGLMDIVQTIVDKALVGMKGAIAA